ncbi:MAG: sulfotransferase [Gammaproteobacteria bacterium]|nr:sulfotransferase [Gammaproteobacteria bacterium]
MSQTIITALKKVKKLIASGQYDKAESLCIKVLNKEPEQANALYLSGNIGLHKNDYAHAIDVFTKAVAIKSDHSSAHSGLCKALTKSGNIEAAIEAGEKAIMLAPASAIAHYNLANSYASKGDFDGSFKHLLKASLLSPKHPGIQFDLGNTYVSRGKIDVAKKCFKTVLKLLPNHLVAYGNLVRITKYNSTNHEDVSKLKSFIYQSGLSDEQRATALFSLGKIYQDCTLYDEAFTYFKHGNQILDKKHQFNPAQAMQAASLIKNHCTNDLFKQKGVFGNASKTPIFIVGTPRSGSTLTEQIISSHPDVFGAGELQWFPETVRSLAQNLKTTLPYPKCLSELTENDINKLASKYLEYTRTLANGEFKIIDKMPGNFLHLGLIHILFPNAKIIHCRREARDACISMYCNQFPLVVPYSYDLYKLGVFYNQYEHTMEHWHKVLPSSSIIDVKYENLVKDQEVESRRLIDFLELKWHDNCLSFYKHKRRVATASDIQITKPMYSSSIDRWKHYEKHLQPLEDGFKYQAS